MKQHYFGFWRTFFKRIKISLKMDSDLRNSQMENSTPQIDSELESIATKNTYHLYEFVFLLLIIHLNLFTFLVILLPKGNEILITNIHWKTVVDIEAYQPVEDFGLYVPDDAQLLYCQNELSKYKLVGTNSHGIRRIHTTPTPTYQTVYHYLVDRWCHTRTITASENNHNPYWGVIELQENERIMGQYQAFFVTGINSNFETVTIAIPYEQWKELKKGYKIIPKF